MINESKFVNILNHLMYEFIFDNSHQRSAKGIRLRSGSPGRTVSGVRYDSAGRPPYNRSLGFPARQSGVQVPRGATFEDAVDLRLEGRVGVGATRAALVAVNTGAGGELVEL